MNLTRAAGRTMLASFFVVNGAKAAAKPNALVADAEPIVRKAVPLVQRVAPPSVANYVPEDTRTLVRATGIAQLLGGLGLASGLGRRASATLLSASMVPHVLASRPAKGATAEEQAASRSVLLRNVALLGATLIASQDTQGKPSLGYRANQQAQSLSKVAAKEKRQLERSAKDVKKQARSLAGQTNSKKAQKSLRSWKKQGKDQVSSLTGQIESLLS